MRLDFKILLATLGVLALSSCSEASRNAANWEFATSAEVLRITPTELAERLGAPATSTMPSSSPNNDLVYKIGECTVIYNIKGGQIWRVHIPLEQACTVRLKDVPPLDDVEFRNGMRYRDMPSALIGTWRGNCIASFCGPGTLIWFINPGERNEGRVGIQLGTTLAPEQMWAREKWGGALMGSPDLYSAEANLQVVCGTADQIQAGTILKDLKITDVNFGYEIDESRVAGCPPPNPSVSVLGGGRTVEKIAPPVRAGMQEPVTSAQIVGPWVPKGQPCESDAGIDFGGDGTWQTVDRVGTWKIENGLLTMVTLEEGDLDGHWRKLNNPQTSEAAVQVTSKEMRQRFSDGTSDIHLLRCPSQF